MNSADLATVLVTVVPVAIVVIGYVVNTFITRRWPRG